MNVALCDFSICGALEKHLLTYLLTYITDFYVSNYTRLQGRIQVFA